MAKGEILKSTDDVTTEQLKDFIVPGMSQIDKDRIVLGLLFASGVIAIVASILSK